MKKLISDTVNKITSALGYKIIKLKESNKIYPFVRKYELHGINFSMWIANEVADQWYGEKNHENSAELKELLRLTQPSDRVLDFGANHGFFSIIVANAVTDNGFVLGIEAFPKNAVIAHANVCLNDLSDRLKIINAAGGSLSGDKIAFSDSINSRVVEKRTKGLQMVSSVSGDDLDSKYGPFNFLKIDVEGFEGEVLKGCRNILKRRPKIDLEIHLDSLVKYNSSLKEILEMLDINHYKGTMFIRPDYFTILPFNPSNLPPSGIINIFLTPV